MWTLRNMKNGDVMRFDDASVCIAVFNLMKREGYSMSVLSPDGTTILL